MFFMDATLLSESPDRRAEVHHHCERVFTHVTSAESGQQWTRTKPILYTARLRGKLMNHLPPSQTNGLVTV